MSFGLVSILVLIASGTARLWATEDSATIIVLLAPLIVTLFLLMSYVSGPLTRDMASGTTLTLRASAVSTSAVVLGISAALILIAALPTLVLMVGTIMISGVYTHICVPFILTALIAAPLTAISCTTVTIGMALWRGANMALVVPWITTMLLGATLLVLSMLAEMPTTSVGSLAIVWAVSLTMALLAVATLTALPAQLRN